MANILKRFNKKIVGADGKIYDFISKINAAGDFKQIEDLDVIITSWNNILATPKRSYIHDPEYGSELHKLVWEPKDETTIERIKTEITDTLIYYDNRASITNIDVILNTSGNGYQVNIEIEYKETTSTLNLTFDENVVSDI